MDYKRFRAEAGITTGDMIKAVKDVCPKYSKCQQSFVDQPDKYGLCLLPSIDKLLASRFGSEGKAEAESESKPVPKRTKPHRLVVYLPDELNEQFAQIRAREGCTTQELLKDLIENWLIATRDL